MPGGCVPVFDGLARPATVETGFLVAGAAGAVERAGFFSWNTKKKN